ncbi:MAG: NUDIX hydrolase [Nitrospirae bacterium]|nr:NUDIX hydrolase [Nitrospirota bacterium]
MSRPPTIRKLASSGGVIFRDSAKGAEVALVSVKKRIVWCLPKGIIEKGEEPDKTALREVAEETGLSGKILEQIGQISYWYFLKEKTIRVHKTVHFFLLKYASGSTDNHDHEVEEARWFPVDEAIERLQYKGEKDIMMKAKQMIEAKYIKLKNADIAQSYN